MTRVLLREGDQRALENQVRYAHRVATINKELAFRAEYGFRWEMRDMADETLLILKRTYERGASS